MDTNSTVKLTSINSTTPATGEAPGAGGNRAAIVDAPDPEVAEKKPRRRFTAKYKLRILHDADNCTEPGQLPCFAAKGFIHPT